MTTQPTPEAAQPQYYLRCPICMNRKGAKYENCQTCDGEGFIATPTNDVLAALAVSPLEAQAKPERTPPQSDSSNTPSKPERLMASASGPLSVADFSRKLADDIWAISDGVSPDKGTLRAMIRARLVVGLEGWSAPTPNDAVAMLTPAADAVTNLPIGAAPSAGEQAALQLTDEEVADAIHGETSVVHWLPESAGLTAVTDRLNKAIESKAGEQAVGQREEPIRVRLEKMWDTARGKALTWADFKTDLIGRIEYEWAEEVRALHGAGQPEGNGK